MKSGLGIIRDGLRQAVLYGTVKGIFDFIDGAAGKTGTSDAGAGRTSGWFVGFWPHTSPWIALLVYLKNGTGANDTAPMARTIFRSYAGLFRGDNGCN